jgi:hypothetical protein
MADDDLDKLCRAQIRDDAAHKLRPRRREVRECDLTPGRIERRGNLDRFPAPRDRMPSVLIGFSPTWGAEIVGFDPKSSAPCPACHAAELREHEHCVVCSSQPSAPRRWPNMDPRERARILAGPGPLAAKVEKATRKSRRKAMAC